RLRAPRVPRLRVVRGPWGNGEEELGLPQRFELAFDAIPLIPIVAAAGIALALLVGLSQAGGWDAFLKWRYSGPFWRADPLFGNDLSFYVFSLPVYATVRDWALLTLFLAALLAAGTYWASGAIVVEDGFPRLAAAPIRHLSALLAMFFLVKAGDYVLQR